jgi:hypothetical protein
MILEGIGIILAVKTAVDTLFGDSSARGSDSPPESETDHGPTSDGPNPYDGSTYDNSSSASGSQTTLGDFGI